MSEPSDDQDPWLGRLDAYTRDYTRKEVADLVEAGLAHYDGDRAVWVVQGPDGPFDLTDAELLDDNPDRYLPDAHQTRFDGFDRETLDHLVRTGLAEYHEQRAVWVIQGEGGPFEVRNVDAPAHGVTAAAGRPPLEAFIDRATMRYDAGQPPTSQLENIVFRALAAADADDGVTTGWREDLLRQLQEAGIHAWYETAPADPADTRPPVRGFDEESVRHAAQRMSGTGEQVDVTLVASDGNRSLIGSYLNQQPLPDAGGERTDDWPEPPPWPTGPVPFAVEVAGRPLPIAPGDPRATPIQFPQGIWPLPATAQSGGPLRPARLMYADGTPLDFRPIGNSQSVPAVAAGVIPAADDLTPGWLQVIQRGERGNLLAVHPALVSPRDVNPRRWLPYREQQRFNEFDSAEAAGRWSALLQARYVNEGDRIRTAAGETHEVTEVTFGLKPSSLQSDGLTVLTATTGPGGHMSVQEHDGNERVEVLIPPRHAAEDTPDAPHLFAVPQPPSGPRAGARAEITDLDATLDWVRRGGSPARPSDPLTPLPGQQHDAASITMAEALQRGAGPAGRPADDAIAAQAGWRVSVAMTSTMRHAQDTAAAAIPGLPRSPDWLRLHSLTSSARQLAADASAGRLRFTDPAWALRSWRAVWARVCEMTCDLAAKLMTGRLRGPAGHRAGSRAWQAARKLHHAAAEGAAHAHGWLPRDMRLPAGSYEPADGRSVSAVPARAKANTAARRHGQVPGPIAQLDFPGPLARVPGPAPPGRQDRPRRGRGAAASRPAGTRSVPPRPG